MKNIFSKDLVLEYVNYADKLLKVNAAKLTEDQRSLLTRRIDQCLCLAEMYREIYKQNETPMDSMEVWSDPIDDQEIHNSYNAFDGKDDDEIKE